MRRLHKIMLLNRLLVHQFALLFMIAMLFAGCDNNTVGTETNGNGKGTLEVLLHDAPANYEEVNVFIERVEVNNADSDSGWVEINSPQRSYDLLELTNGATEVLGSAELEAGTYEQIRLILSSDGHNVIVDGAQKDLFVPSGEQTGIKLNVNAEIKPDITYTLLLDFDVARSVVERGNEQSGVRYLLKPVISASNQAETGNVAGIVEPVESMAYVYAISNSDTISTTKADTTDGSFKLIGLEDGTYLISVDPTSEGYQSQDTTGVDVTAGETSDIGTIILPEN